MEDFHIKGNTYQIGRMTQKKKSQKPEEKGRSSEKSDVLEKEDQKNFVIESVLSSYQLTNLVELHEWNHYSKGIHWNIKILR